ncbi:hypothetical protein M0R45_016985 [Rubus argutus]|uniref:DUF4283 domain-containing protein n=1 Tax=Rubus argutus TaxID=59490 RepID=A0AAW1XU31_RUBAR
MDSDEEIELVPRAEEDGAELFYLAGALIARKHPHKLGVFWGPRRAWGALEDEDIQIILVIDRIYSFVVRQESVATHIVNSGPWNIDNCLLNIFPWPRDLAIEDIDFSPIQFWIQIHGQSPIQIEVGLSTVFNHLQLKRKCDVSEDVYRDKRKKDDFAAHVCGLNSSISA